jgi:hypothetical protein
VSSFSHEREVVIDGLNGSPRSDSKGNPDIFGFSLLNSSVLCERKSLNRLTKRAISFNLRQHIKQNADWKFAFFLKAIRFLTSILISFQLKELINLKVARGIGFDPAVKQSKLSNYFVGYFQSYLWGSESQIALKKSLNFISKSTTIEKYESLAKSEVPLVVHVRLGDYLLENGFGTPSPEYYSQAIKYALRTGTYGKIWLYSDDLPRAISLLPSDLDIELRMIDEIDASPSATLETMRFGQGYVIANSTFSWWGAFLSYSDNPLVIYPSPWFKSIESPAKLVPPTWVPFESK